MITKIIYPDSFNLGVPAASLLGFDKYSCRTGLQKRASCIEIDTTVFERKPGYAYLHVITTGAVETYGSNANADGFNETYRLHKFAAPKDPNFTSVDLDGGLLKYHNDTFEKLGGVYKHHQNRHKKGSPSGYIVKAAYNKEMHRGELLIGVDENIWAKELEKLANEEPIYFSIGADVKYDICLPAGSLVKTITGYKPIEKIKLGEKVKTHKGLYKPVKQTYERITNILMDIETAAHGTIALTPNHPVFTVRRRNMEHILEFITNPVEGEYIIDDLLTLCWCEARQLSLGDYLCLPVLISPYNEYTSLAVISGLYVGSYLSGNCFVENNIKCLKIPRSVLSSISDLLLRNREQDFINSQILCEYKDDSVIVKLVGLEINSLLKNMFGDSIDNMFISVNVTDYWSQEDKFKFLQLCLKLAAILDISDNNYCKIISKNKGLLLDFSELTASLNICSSLINEGADLYSLKIIASILNAADPGKVVKRFYTIEDSQVILKSYAFYKIKGLRIYPVDSVKVYNLSVEDDESYVANGFTVHNCSYCGSIHRKRSDYCEHLNKYGTAISKEGVQIYAINDAPIFHDISGVIKPADKIAFGLRKIASEGILTGADLAELAGLTPSLKAIDYINRRFDGSSKRLDTLRKLATIEKRIMCDPVHFEDLIAPVNADFSKLPDSLIAQLSKNDLDKVFGSLKKAKILLSPEEFFKLLMGDRFDEIKDNVAEIPEAMLGLFNIILNSDSRDSWLDNSCYECGTPSLFEVVKPYIESASLEPDIVSKRIIIINIKKPKKLAKLVKLASIISPTTDLLAREYARYVLSFAENMPEPVQYLTIIKTASKV